MVFRLSREGVPVLPKQDLPKRGRPCGLPHWDCRFAAGVFKLWRGFARGGQMRASGPMRPIGITGAPGLCRHEQQA